MAFVDGFACPLGIQSLCFHSSLGPGDWASWAQAIGTIAAVWYSSRLWRRSAYAELSRAAGVAGVFSASLFAALENMREACETKQLDRLFRFANELAEITAFGRTVTFDRLPRDAMAHFFELRGVAARLAEIAGRFESSTRIDFPGAELAFKNLRNETSFLSGVLAERLNDWPDVQGAAPAAERRVHSLRLGGVELTALWSSRARRD